MSLYKRFAVDEKKMADGVWHDFARNDDGTIPGFRLRRCHKSNTQWTSRFEEVTRPKRKLMEAKLLSERENELLTREAWIGTVLVDWRNIQGPAGEDLGPFTAEKAAKLLDDLPELWDELWRLSLNGDLYRPGDLEDDAKN